jgi:hypothetical protein
MEESVVINVDALTARTVRNKKTSEESRRKTVIAV